MSLLLYLRVYTLRFLQNLGRYCDLYLSTPLPQRPTFTRQIKSAVGSIPGEFDLLFYYPPGYDRTAKNEKLPLLINFHGGGYAIGHAADDARFLTFIQHRAPCLAVSINYRLALEYPFPTGITDCVTSILYLWSHAQELNIDSSLTALSGFSAGGQFCFTASYRLYEEVQQLRAKEQLKEEDIGKIKGILTFYAPADWTKSRHERAESNPLTQPLSRIPGFFFGMFEQAYFLGYEKGELDFEGPLLSPGLASEKLIREALPRELGMISCEWDSLLVEGERFRERLKALGKSVDGYVVKGVPHGWDKWPSLFWGGRDKKRDEAYKYAAERMREFWSCADVW